MPASEDVVLQGEDENTRLSTKSPGRKDSWHGGLFSLLRIHKKDLDSGEFGVSTFNEFGKKKTLDGKESSDSFPF